MQKYTLKNKITLIFDRKSSDSVTICVTVKVGSNNETKKILGISHFLEHMVFEGTKNRANSTIIANEIERLGGELNAYTSNERTTFYIKVQKKHFDIALDIISDITQNPLFKDKSIEKERNIILKEINMVTDEPRFHQWVLFTQTLFKTHPSKYPAYGTIKTVKGITKKDLQNYFKKYYVPNNMIISVVGGISDPKEKIERAFSKIKPGPIKELTTEEPQQTTIQKTIEKKKILNSYMVLGYKTPIRLHKDSYTLDIIKALLARGQSGKIVEEIRSKRGLAYEVNVYHDPNKDFGTFAVYLNTDKKNIKKAIGIILNEFDKLKNITTEELDDAKGFLEGSYILEKEDTRHTADELNFWEMIKDSSLNQAYLSKIKSITKKDIKETAKRYLTKNYTLAVIEQTN